MSVKTVIALRISYLFLQGADMLIYIAVTSDVPINHLYLKHRLLLDGSLKLLSE